MRPVYCCPSRGRPENIERLVAAWHDTQANSLLDLVLDEGDPRLDDYLSIQLPHFGWTRQVGPDQRPSDAMNSTFARYPGAPAYGFIGDDALPRTKHWDRTLARAAGNFAVAYPMDLHKNRCSHPVVGGALVRAVGWFGCPEVKHLCLDTAWAHIGEELDALVPCHHVVVEHLHPCTGKVERDVTYFKPTGGNDLKKYKSWLNSDNRRSMMEQLRIDRLSIVGSAAAG